MAIERQIHVFLHELGHWYAFHIKRCRTFLSDAECEYKADLYGWHVATLFKIPITTQYWEDLKTFKKYKKMIGELHARKYPRETYEE